MSGGETGEDSKERIDRELIEFLNGLRVVMPGVQVLFAFLLVVPFNTGFEKITSFQKDVYFACLLSTAVSAVLLMCPAAYHRVDFRQHVKQRMLMHSNRLAIVGIGFLALSMTLALLLITDLLFGTTQAVIVTTATAAMFVGCWYLLPLVARDD